MTNDSRRHAAKLAEEAAPGAPESVKAKEVSIIEAELNRRAMPDEQASPLTEMAPEAACRLISSRAMALMAEAGATQGQATAELVKSALASMACRLGDPALLPGWLEALAEEMRKDPTPPNFSTPTAH